MNKSNDESSQCAPVDQQYWYTGVIYAHKTKYMDNYIYDVKLYRSSSKLILLESKERNQIYVISIQSEKQISMLELSQYMRWKFRKYQVSVGNKLPICTFDTFTQIKHNIEWIRSILDVEFDYHIGDRTCLLEKNKKALSNYVRKVSAGYGVN